MTKPNLQTDFDIAILNRLDLGDLVKLIHLKNCSSTGNDIISDYLDYFVVSRLPLHHRSQKKAKDDFFFTGYPKGSYG